MLVTFREVYVDFFWDFFLVSSSDVDEETPSKNATSENLLQTLPEPLVPELVLVEFIFGFLEVVQVKLS